MKELGLDGKDNGVKEDKIGVAGKDSPQGRCGWVGSLIEKCILPNKEVSDIKHKARGLANPGMAVDHVTP